MSSGPLAQQNDDAERCLLYLLGELNSEQATAFEQELKGSTGLQDELIVQSNLLCGLAGDQLLATTHSHATHPVWRTVATIAALAACLMIAFFAWPRAIDNDTKTVADAAPEGLLIAQAWADGSLDAPSSDWDVTDDEVEEALLPSEADDSSLSWIVAAAEAGVVIDG